MVHLRYGITVEDGCDDDVGVFQPRHLESFLLVSLSGCSRHAECEQRHFPESVGHHCPLDESGIAGGPALASRLAHHHGRVVQVILSALQGFDDVADDERGRIAYFVVGIFQTEFRTLFVAHGKHFHIVADEFQHRVDDGREVFRHVGGEYFAPGIPSTESPGLFKSCRFLPLSGPHLVVEAFHKRAHTQFQTAYVAHVVYLQQCERFAVSLQDVPHLILDESVGAAPERGHFHKMQPVVLVGRPLSAFDNAIHERPLLHEIGVSGTCFRVSPYDVVANHIYAQ